eukprot:gene7875-biopygen18079
MSGHVPARSVARLAGLLISISVPVPVAPVLARGLGHAILGQDCLPGKLSRLVQWDATVPLLDWVKMQTSTFLAFLTRFDWWPSAPVPPHFVIESDASDHAEGGSVYPFGARARQHAFHRQFSGPAQSVHINIKEISGLHQGLRSLAWLFERGELSPPSPPTRVYCCVDNTTLLFPAKGGSRSVQVQRAVAELHLTAFSFGMVIMGLQYIPSDLHQPADDLSRLKDPPGWSLTNVAFHRFVCAIAAKGAPLATMDALGSRQRSCLPRFCSAWVDPDAACKGFWVQEFADEILWVNARFCHLREVERHLVAIRAVGYALIPTVPQWCPPHLSHSQRVFRFDTADFEHLGESAPPDGLAPGGDVVWFDFRQ